MEQLRIVSRHQGAQHTPPGMSNQIDLVLVKPCAEIIDNGDRVGLELLDGQIIRIEPFTARLARSALVPVHHDEMFLDFQALFPAPGHFS